MSNFRSDAEKFVTEFLDYVNRYDILDHLNKQTQRMERSAGVHALVKQAEKVFPERKPQGESAEAMRNLTDEQRNEAIGSSPNVVDTRAMFAAKVLENGGTRGLLRAVLTGNQEALEDAKEFIKAVDGEKDFS